MSQPAKRSTPAVSEADLSRAVERMAEEMATSGMQRMAARTFAALLCSDSGSLTAAEIGRLLQVSPAAVSGSVRYLEQVDLIRRTRRPGSRRNEFMLGDDFWYETFAHRDGVLRSWQRSMAEAADIVGRGTPAGARLAESESFFEFLRAEIPAMMDRWHQRQERTSTSV